MSSKDKTILVGLVGNPNSGKSTIFNHITGARQHVGNYPGVTVEKKEGEVAHNGYSIKVVDLPGTYSLLARSEDEVVARNFILQDKPDVIVHVVDASNLERNLYLYTQLSELQVPIVLAMNMSDMLEEKGLQLDYSRLSKNLGKPLVETIGHQKKGIKDLLNKVVDVYEGKIELAQSKVDYGREIQQELENIKNIIMTEKDVFGDYPMDWIVLKLLEKDPLAMQLANSLSEPQKVFEQIEKSRHHLIQHFDEDTEVLVADRRYGFVSGVCKDAVVQTAQQRQSISDKIDQVVLNRFLGLPIFALVMYGIFKFTFTFSEPVVLWCEMFFEQLSAWTTSLIPEGLIQSFLVDGVIAGVGGVLGFFPLVLFMFFAIAFFEDTGYMARAAFVMDRIMHKFGLHGKSFLPLMISTNGCAVPGILATRTLDSKKDRLITMMVTPFMICGAKLPIFALFIGAFFAAEQGANMMFLMYALSIVIAFVSAWILKTFVLKGETTHFVMELPPYRIPTILGLLLKMWERGWEYLQKAGTIILLFSILIWGAFTFPEMEAPEGLDDPTVVAAMQMEYSFAGKIGKALQPVFEPIGMDWRAGIALMAGVAAKEIVVSTLGTIYSLGEVDVDEPTSLKEALSQDPTWSPLKALSFLMFVLIYLPCVVATTVFFRESGSSLKWTGFLIFWTMVLAWGASFLVYRGGMLLGLQ